MLNFSKAPQSRKIVFNPKGVSDGPVIPFPGWSENIPFMLDLVERASGCFIAFRQDSTGSSMYRNCKGRQVNVRLWKGVSSFVSIEDQYAFLNNFERLVAYVEWRMTVAKDRRVTGPFDVWRKLEFWPKTHWQNLAEFVSLYQVWELFSQQAEVEAGTKRLVLSPRGNIEAYFTKDRRQGWGLLTRSSE